MIATSPLTGAIYSGGVNQKTRMWIGNKKDVTSEVIGAIIEKAEFHGGSFQVNSGDEQWKITVEKIK